MHAQRAHELLQVDQIVASNLQHALVVYLPVAVQQQIAKSRHHLQAIR